MSIPCDKWVKSSNGEVLSCEQLFDELNDTKLVRLTDYDFQDMYEVNEYAYLGRLIEETNVPVYDPDTDIFSHTRYVNLLKTGAVVYFKGLKHFFCVEFGLPLLEGSWVDEEGSCRATAEFLFYVLNEDETITLVND